MTVQELKTNKLLHAQIWLTLLILSIGYNIYSVLVAELENHVTLWTVFVALLIPVYTFWAVRRATQIAILIGLGTR